ncbi:unnamed protein product [Agarophyton chilense]
MLPLLVRTARASFVSFWRVLMAQLAPSDAQGRYVRPSSRVSLSYDGSPFGQTVAAVSRSFAARHHQPPYAVYVGLACQWCHRVLLARALLNLHQSIELRLLNPGEEGLWRLADPQRYDSTVSTLKAVYYQMDRKYSGRFTAPLFVQVDQDRIVSNESADILRLLAESGPVSIDEHTVVCLRPTKQHGLDVDPHALEQLCQTVYTCVNDGVYRCGFATSQLAYEEAESNLFSTLDHIEALLTHTRFLCSPSVITEADVRLFPTIFRFDSVYAVLFKACRKSIRADYPAISAWMRDIYNLPRVAETCDLEATRNNYYTSLFPLNPSAIVPVPPPQDLSPAPERRTKGSSNELVSPT